MTQPVIVRSPKGREIVFGGGDTFPIIAGPCVVESREVLRHVAEELKLLEDKQPVSFVFKSSYRKANRTSGNSFTGIGDEAALALLADIKKEFDLPIISDVHLPDECAVVAEICDILQIPAFLSRQSDLLCAAAETGRVVNIKKAQFMSPQDMKFAREKVIVCGSNNVLVTERGSSFGYGDLVVDFRSIEVMREFGAPIIYDATHSVQRPSQNGVSGGERRFILPLARAAMAVGIDGLFVETHPDPAKAKSDAASQLPLSELQHFIASALAVRESR